MDTTSYDAVSTLPGALAPKIPTATGTDAMAHSTAHLLQRTTTVWALEAWPYPLDRAAVERRAHELRSAYIAKLAQRWTAALRPTFRRIFQQRDRQARFIWP